MMISQVFVFIFQHQKPLFFWNLANISALLLFQLFYVCPHRFGVQGVDSKSFALRFFKKPSASGAMKVGNIEIKACFILGNTIFALNYFLQNSNMKATLQSQLLKNATLEKINACDTCTLVLPMSMVFQLLDTQQNDLILPY